MGPMPMLAMQFQGPEEYKIPELRAEKGFNNE